MSLCSHQTFLNRKFYSFSLPRASPALTELLRRKGGHHKSKWNHFLRGEGRKGGGFPNGKRGGASSEEEEEEALIAPIPTKATPEWASVKWYLSAESVGAKVEGRLKISSSVETALVSSAGHHELLILRLEKTNCTRTARHIVARNLYHIALLNFLSSLARLLLYLRTL